TFNAFAAAHPWVGTENIRPKSIAREMYESFKSFDEYVRDYDLQRSEGLLLRYLSEAYKVIAQTVPETARNEEIDGMIVYFSSMIRQVDSSLLDEWEKLRNPDSIASDANALPTTEASTVIDITRDTKAFTALVRNDCFRLVRALAIRDYLQVLQILGLAD